ncbi:MAG: hypothetical protein IKA83_06645 [Paludibacteraceae bacterium]|nr:hypothetical protein [Paludibacteraceae bacterium]
MELNEEFRKEMNDKRNERYSEVSKKSSKVSDVNLKLNIAGIANVWLALNYPLLEEHNVLLFIALFLFVLSIFCEYVHYIITVIVNKKYSSDNGLVEIQEDELKISKLPMWTVNLTWVFWGIKILLTFSGYIILGTIVGICLC